MRIIALSKDRLLLRALLSKKRFNIALHYKAEVPGISYNPKQLVTVFIMRKLGEKPQLNELRTFLHDIRSPLTNIGINLELLNDKTREVPLGIEDSINSAINSFNYINVYLQSLDVSIMHSKDFFDPLGQVTFLLSNYFSEEFERRNIRFTLRSSRNIQLYGNKFNFRRTVYNILTNSIEAFEETEDKNRKIKIFLLETNKNIHLDFKDNGVGLSKVAGLQTPYRTTKYGHYGIGLEIVKKTMSEFHGKFEISSAEDGYTLARLTFPKLH